MLPQSVQARGDELGLSGVDQRGVLGLQRVKWLGWELLKVLGIQDLQGKKKTMRSESTSTSLPMAVIILICDMKMDEGPIHCPLSNETKGFLLLLSALLLYGTSTRSCHGNGSRVTAERLCDHDHWTAIDQEL